jgi:Ser/Thr protein kinase RdoA (MazF antagonist)
VSWDTVDFHARALTHLEHVAPELPVARMVPDLAGELVPVLERGDDRHAMRLVTFLPGITFDDGMPISDNGLSSIGRLVGALSVALADFDHPAADGVMPWDIANGLVLEAALWDGLGDDARDLLAPARDRLECALVGMRRLPRQVIHNDAHGGNLIRATEDSDVVSGVIDFGDLVRTAAVADLGVSGANLVPQQADPVGALAALVRGFHDRRPLGEDERAAVPELVLARLALSVLFTDYQVRHAPHIAAAVADERPHLLASLERWLALDQARLGRALEDALT